MSEQWDGRPQNPERDGWHWLQRADDGWLVCKWWSAEQAGWVDGITLSPATVVEYGASYLGPCLTPTEVAAREAAARREGIAQALDAAQTIMDGYRGKRGDMLKAIRALLEDGR